MKSIISKIPPGAKMNSADLRKKINRRAKAQNYSGWWYS